MQTYLKIKIVSLGDEIRRIRREELKWKTRRDRDVVFWGLRGHRMWLRPMARNAQVAYAFLRGKPYVYAEPTARTHPDWSVVESNVRKFAGTKFVPTDAEREKLLEDLKAWVAEAKRQIDHNIVQHAIEQRERAKRRAASRAKLEEEVA